MIRRHLTVNRDVENQILIALITSDKVLRGVEKLLEAKLFPSQVGKIVTGWILDYFKTYGESPKSLIQNIYNQNADSIKAEDADQIADFLSMLSEEYVNNPPNEDFMLNEAVDFLKRQRLRVLTNEVDGILSANGNLADAEFALTRYSADVAAASRWDSPFDDLDYMERVFAEQEQSLFDVPGELGRFLGPLRRKYLFGIMGPMKRGKTFWLGEFAFYAMLQRRRVAMISLEMDSMSLAKRFYRRLTAFGDENRPYRIVVFDCQHNQTGACNLPQRVCRVQIGTPQYRPCTVCQGTENYSRVVYETRTTTEEFDEFNTQRELRRFIRNNGRDLFRVISYPPFTANLNTITNDISILHYNGFFPDVIVIDYADIMAPEIKRGEVRHQIDDTWKALKRLAAEMQVLVITGTQGSRATLQKEIIEQTDVSEDIRKLAHVDLMMALSQTRRERQQNTMRLNLLAHRWKEFDPYKTLAVTYQFELGQPVLDMVEGPYMVVPEQGDS